MALCMRTACLPHALSLLAMIVGAVVLTAADGVFVTLSPSSLGRTFDGIGAVSGGGGGTRLLIDYPEAVRSDILDFLFLPGFGASLQTLKVEIGCDGNTTQGSEQTHQRFAGDMNMHRGYELWLMNEARKRNPKIHLSALQWGVPGWIADEHGNVDTERNVQYVLEWIEGAQREFGLTLNSLGVHVGSNEGRFNATYIKTMRSALDQAGFSHVKTLAADQCCTHMYDIVDAMLDDAELARAIDIIAVHDPWRGSGGVDPPAKDIARLNKPLWSSESHIGLVEPDGAPCWSWAGVSSVAQKINQEYILANATASLFWTPVYAWYDWIDYAGHGLLAANEPWSGSYLPCDTLWTVAHTTQFVSPGWRYVTNGAALLPAYAGSYVSYVSSDGTQLSIVVETVNATTTSDISFRLTGSFARISSLFRWQTNQTVSFVRGANATVSATTPGLFTVRVAAGTVMTLTTVGGQRKGTVPYIAPSQPSLPLPHTEHFDVYANDSLVPYVCDTNGAFSTFIEANGNGVLRQQTPTRPIATDAFSTSYFWTQIGTSDWRTYSVTVRVLVERAEGVADKDAFITIGSHGAAWRTTQQALSPPDGPVFRVAMDGSWQLYAVGRLLASGHNGTWTYDKWFTATLFAYSAAGDILAVQVGIDDVRFMEPVRITTRAAGPASLGTGIHHARFDDLAIIMII